MRVAVVLCLIALIGISTAARTGIQAKLIHDGMGAKMQGRSLNKALNLMAEIHTALPGANKGAQALLDALSALKDNISQNQADEIESFQYDTDGHREEVARLTGEIAQGEKTILYLNDEVQSYTQQEEITNLNLQAQDARLVEAKVTRDNTLAIIAQLDQEYEATQNDFGQCINVLDQCIEKINEAKGWTSTMFIQQNRNSFKQFQVVLQENLSQRFDPFYYQPILQIFAQLTTHSKDDLDLNAIVQASNSINNLRTYLLDGLNEATVNYNTSLEDYNQVLKLIKDEIADLSLVTMPNTQTSLDQIRETLQGKQSELKTTTETLALMKTALENEEKNWVNRVQQNELLLPEFESEYNAVCSAETVIKQKLGEAGVTN